MLSEVLQGMLNLLAKLLIQPKNKITQLRRNQWMTSCMMKNAEDMHWLLINAIKLPFSMLT